MSGGCARPSVSGRFGCIDKQGKLVINPQFSLATPFSDGMAMVKTEDLFTGKWGYISR